MRILKLKWQKFMTEINRSEINYQEYVCDNLFCNLYFHPYFFFRHDWFTLGYDIAGSSFSKN